MACRFSGLLDEGGAGEPRLRRRHPVAARRAQAEWHDPDSGHLRRTLTPCSALQPLQLSEATLPAGASIIMDALSAQAQVHQQLWLLAGRLDVRIGLEISHLREGDCMAMQLEAPLRIHNPGHQIARYLMASTAATAPAQRLKRPCPRNAST